MTNFDPYFRLRNPIIQRLFLFFYPQSATSNVARVQQWSRLSAVLVSAGGQFGAVVIACHDLLVSFRVLPCTAPCRDIAESHSGAGIAVATNYLYD